MRQPSVVVVCGPNGAGKSTAAPFLLRDALSVSEYVNADLIAQGLSVFNPGMVAVTAGRLMLARLEELSRQRATFGFETTLASRSFAPWLRRRIDDGYSLHLVFLWLASSELAIARVARRVVLGGHTVTDDVVRRRYGAGLRNFFELYQPLSTTWRMYDNGNVLEPRLIARGENGLILEADAPLWNTIVRQSTGRDG